VRDGGSERTWHCTLALPTQFMRPSPPISAYPEIDDFTAATKRLAELRAVRPGTTLMGPQIGFLGEYGLDVSSMCWFYLVNQLRYHSWLLGLWLQAHEELYCRYCIYTKILFFPYVPARSLQFHISQLLVSTSAISRACAGLPISNSMIRMLPALTGSSRWYLRRAKHRTW
jgi:hypothetical protein